VPVVKYLKKIESSKDLEPPISFFVKVGEGKSAEDANSRLWSDLRKKTDKIQINSIRVMPKGDIKITPADGETLNAMKALNKKDRDITQINMKWPMVTVYDVDASLPESALPENLIRQNVNLGIPLSKKGEKVIKPVFRTGPRGKDTVHWVCQVRPDVHKCLVGTRIYLGLTSCRVQEYYDYKRCSGCQKYGHREIFCETKTIVCSYCAETGHREKECRKKYNSEMCKL